MYIDPGAGSLMLQALAAGLISAALVLRRGRDAVWAFLSSLAGRLRRR